MGPNALKWLNEFNEARKQLRFFFRTFVAFSLWDYYPVVHYFIDLVVEMFGEDAVTPKMAMSLIVVPYFVSKYEPVPLGPRGSGRIVALHRRSSALYQVH